VRNARHREPKGASVAAGDLRTLYRQHWHDAALPQRQHGRREDEGEADRDGLVGEAEDGPAGGLQEHGPEQEDDRLGQRVDKDVAATAATVAAAAAATAAVAATGAAAAVASAIGRLSAQGASSIMVIQGLGGRIGRLSAAARLCVALAAAHVEFVEYVECLREAFATRRG
jgi:hypothetical protein